MYYLTKECIMYKIGGKGQECYKGLSTNSSDHNGG